MAELREGRISDADIERARSQIGIPVAARHRSWNPVPDASSISHFAFGIGDDNPLWHDRDYAATTRWGDQIAPPMYAISAGVCTTAKFEDPERKAQFRGLFRGVGKYLASTQWEWFRPIRPGDELFHDGHTMLDVEVKTSTFSAGRSVVERLRTIYALGDGSVAAVRTDTLISAERQGSRKAGKHASITRQHYTAEDIARIDADYAQERRRGAEPRWWDDTEVGEDLGRIVKGPMTVLDVIGMHMAMGFGAYAIGPLKYNWQARQKMPAFFINDEYGVPDVVQRLHWDPKRASDIGLPAPYDYGQMRFSWVSHLITNWMGDEAWLTALTAQLKDFNYLGDTHWISGRVTRKYVEDDRHLVDLELAATNQRGTVTVPATATVQLPTRAAGAIVLPEVPQDLAARGIEIARKGRPAGRPDTAPA